ncbi:MAG TPA: hypothetical protein VGK75_07095 [Casimicrobiaceae bacterium]|jgi:hypothetical protein
MKILRAAFLGWLATVAFVWGMAMFLIGLYRVLGVTPDDSVLAQIAALFEMIGKLGWIFAAVLIYNWDKIRSKAKTEDKTKAAASAPTPQDMRAP